ncbi:MAG: tyrosine--tRNA ligase [Thermodesulfobacteriota bacterium]
MSVYEILAERGFIEQCTHADELSGLLAKKNVTCYIGFDPTADSLHVGSLIPIMSLCHMQRAGHRPIALVGGGTGLVGDPSGKTEMRKMLTIETVNHNVEALKSQLSRFLDFSSGKALMANNADWLLPLNYVEFLRDYGRHFSVNRMIKAESYKLRLDSEEGLSFIEFNYMCLQAYDFLHLFRAKDYGCELQMGGSDQWGNIVAGVDLIRRDCGGQAYGLTFPLITTASGAKMGKTAAGAVWLSAEKTSPYDYYQYWVNSHDDDVVRFLKFFTFLPVEEIAHVAKLSGADLNAAKAVLAFEATKLAHGRDEAVKAMEASIAMFGARKVPSGLLPASDIPRKAQDDQEADQLASAPTFAVSRERLAEGIPAFEIFADAGLAGSRGEARRTLSQGGGYINGVRVESFDFRITLSDFTENGAMLRAGKKRYCRLVIA